MTPREGKPLLTVRVPLVTRDKFKEFVGETDKGGGSAGGAGLYLRRLIYWALEEPVPPQWEKDTSPALAVQNHLTAACVDLARWEAEGVDRQAAESLREAVRESAKSEPDALNRTLALQMLGRLTLLLEI